MGITTGGTIGDVSSWVSVAGWLFWASLSLIAYTYVVYPAIVARIASRVPPPVAPETDDARLPTVTVLIAAHNAGRHIGARLANVLACDYPASKLSVLVASDGSSDSTVSQVREWADPRVRVMDGSIRRGKAATICVAMPRVRGEIVLFTDATTRFDVGSIRRLVRHFSAPDVGIAIGDVSILDDRGEPTEGFYWRRESKLRRDETRLGTVLGASGAIYAVRRRLFVDPGRPVINDDLVFPMLVQLSHGCRAVFDASARAYSVVPRGIVVDFRRRCRIGAGGYQSLAVIAERLRPRHWRHALAFGSHKVLRWLAPFLLIVALMANVELAGEPLYDVTLALQLSGYALAGLGIMIGDGRAIGRVPRLAASFAAMNAALLIGFVRWLVDSDAAVWNPTVRPSAGVAIAAARRRQRLSVSQPATGEPVV